MEGRPVRTRTRTRALRRPRARRDCTSYLAHAHCALYMQVTAPPKRKARPSDVARKQRVIQAREERRQQQLPSRGWEDDPP